MTIKESLSELRGRIDDLQKRLGDKVSEFSKDERRRSTAPRSTPCRRRLRR